ncbi:MAG: hypothetical protein A2521_11480, partial [Deltaproteobacteria bacterium RIFOXYD12_FULL_57_12]
MFGIGLPELILIMAVALIVVGPNKLPELAKSLAKGVLELKKAANSLKASLQEEDAKPWQDSATADNADKLAAAYQQLPGPVTPPAAGKEPVGPFEIIDSADDDQEDRTEAGPETEQPTDNPAPLKTT